MTGLETNRVGIAQGFLQRLLGIHGPVASGGAVLFLRCMAVHTLWTRRPLWIVFMARDGRVLSQRLSRWGRLYWCRGAYAVLEIDLTARTQPQKQKQAPQGVAMLEALLAAPIVLLLGLLVVQLILLAHGRMVVGYAAAEAARSAASAQVSAASIDAGLSRGLTPLLGLSVSASAPGMESIAVAAARGQWHYLRGKAEGWIDWKLLSPTAATLTDWGQGDARAVPPAQWHAGSFPAPRSGAAATDAGSGLVIGRDSGQTFLDAGVIRLRVSVGLPLHVPVAGPILARSLAWWRGCSISQTVTLGSLRFSPSVAPYTTAIDSDTAGLNECRLLLAPRLFGGAAGFPARLPVRVIAVAQAQTMFSAQTLPAR